MVYHVRFMALRRFQLILILLFLGGMGSWRSLGQADPKPAIISQPSDVTAGEGSLVRFEVRTTGSSPISYQWQRNRINLPAEINSTLTLETVALSDSGSRFRCVVNNQFGSATSREALLTVTAEKVKPETTRLAPAPQLTVRALEWVEVQFSEPIQGIHAEDLLLNNQPALEMTGAGQGPFLFRFKPPAKGSAQLTWKSDHGITDLSRSPNAFAGGTWTVTIDPAFQIPTLRINEVLADNGNGLRDEDGFPQDWVEIHNPTSAAISLEGWSLSDDSEEPGLWTFPARTIPAGGYLVVFASGKDRRPANAASNLHTSFQLSRSGETLGLFYPEYPRVTVAEMAFPEQRSNYSYGWVGEETRYFVTPTPNAANGASTLSQLHEPPHFNIEGGFFSAPFDLQLTSPSGGTIRYTVDGSEPTANSGVAYTAPIRIEGNAFIRAAVFSATALPSKTITQSYFVGLSEAHRSLPVMSLVTSTNHLVTSNGIVGIFGGLYGSDGRWQSLTPLDYHNPSLHGIAWERPTSVEILYSDGRRHATDAGIRVHGSDYMRPRYKVDSKFSYRLYFRSDYGEGKLNHPLFDSPVTTFDQLVLRAGHNDILNPFIKDELMRRMFSDTGQVSSHGGFVNLFINGVYKGYFNPAERVESDFCQAWHGGGSEWDVIGPFGPPVDGDAVAWNDLLSQTNKNMAIQSNYLEMARRLDLTNFVDYLLVNIYGANGDWPHNNWRIARERKPDGIFRYYIWDAEFAFGANPVSHNSFQAQLAQTEQIPTFFKELMKNNEFRILFADRIFKHFFNGGALTDARIRKRFEELRKTMSGVIPSMNSEIVDNWIPNRRGYITNHFIQAGITAWTNAPTFSRFGGRVPKNFSLVMSSSGGTVYYTLNGTDPRVPFSGILSTHAKAYTPATPLRLTNDVIVKARVRNGQTWSAMTEAYFSVGGLQLPLHFTEIMYHPTGGSAYEYVELYNAGLGAVDLSGFQVEGIDFQFPLGSLLEGNAFCVLVSDQNPQAFKSRYPGVVPQGYFPGSLDNAGERIALLAPDGEIITSVDYQDNGSWPQRADGSGRALERVSLDGDPDDPAAWAESSEPLGSPAKWMPRALPLIRFNEIMADNQTAVPQGALFPDWVELANAGASAMNLEGWSLTDDSNVRKFVFPAGTVIPAGGYLVIWCTDDPQQTGLVAGFKLSKSGETLSLYNATGLRIDALTFGRQLTDYSLGFFAGTPNRWALSRPSPGGANQSAPVASVSSLAINEISSNPEFGEDDFIELYNKSATLPLALQGFTLTATNGLHALKSLSFLGPKEFFLLKADENPGPDHVGFKIRSTGDVISLFDANASLVEKMDCPVQAVGVSRGRLPDGNASLFDFKISRSPGKSNYLPVDSGVTFHEVLAWNTGGVKDAADRVADFVELKNSKNSVVNLAGYLITNQKDGGGGWLVPAGVAIPPNGYLVLWCDPFRPVSQGLDSALNTGLNLSAKGDELLLLTPTHQITDKVSFGLQAANLSFGRNENKDWVLMAQPTPGAANGAVAVLAPANSLRFNEYLTIPERGDGWFELINTAQTPVLLSGLFVSDDPSLAGQKKHVIGPLSFVGGSGWVRLMADGELEKGADHVVFQLDSKGETLRLYQSDLVLIDGISYGLQTRGISEGRFPDGTGAIQSFSAPTPGMANLRDSDQDGLPDVWETSMGVTDPLVDDDKDGLTNIQEYRVGSDPKDAKSRLVLAAPRVLRDNAGFPFTAFANRSLRIERRSFTGGDSWEELLELDWHPTTRVLEFFSNGTSGQGMQMFRLRSDGW